MQGIKSQCRDKGVHDVSSSRIEKKEEKKAIIEILQRAKLSFDVATEGWMISRVQELKRENNILECAKSSLNIVIAGLKDNFVRKIPKYTI